MQQILIINRLNSVFYHLPSVLYICRESSTNQLIFIQNKPNFRKPKMNLSAYSKISYNNKCNWTLGENKPNSPPNFKNFSSQF